jgi:drug/metabolite transporter (DMT)-like permease
MVLFPILGALALATGTLVERIVLMKESIKTKQYQALQFLAITIIMIPFLFFFWKLSPKVFLPKNLLILLGVVILSLAANWFTFTSMKWQKLSNLEPAKMTEPLFVILLVLLFSYIISPTIYERNFTALVPAVIAGLALIFSHIEKKHFTFGKYFVFALIGSFFFASELVLSKLILDMYSPMTFYFARSALVFIGTLIIFRPKMMDGLDKTTKIQVIVTAAIWVAYRIILYYGYTSIGIIETTLMVMLGPVFIYLFAWKFLKEKLTWRNIIASIIIIGCVLYTVLI